MRNSRTPKDSLVTLLENHLNRSSDPKQTEQQLIYEVVGEFIFQLMNQGHIPHHLLDTLETDLREEVLEIYRKKTYGTANLEDYRRRKRAKNKGPAPRSGRN